MQTKNNQTTKETKRIFLKKDVKEDKGDKCAPNVPQQGEWNGDSVSGSVALKHQVPSGENETIFPAPLVTFLEEPQIQPLVVFEPEALVEFEEEPLEEKHQIIPRDLVIFEEEEKKLPSIVTNEIVSASKGISIMGGNLSVFNRNGCTYVKGDEAPMFLMNFDINMLFITKEQIGNLESLVFEVHTEENEIVRFEVPYERRKSLLDVIKRKISYVYLSPTTKNARDIFDVYVGALTKKVPVKTKIKAAGWYDPLKRYITDDSNLGTDYIVDTKKSFERDWSLTDMQLANSIWQMLSISTNKAHGVICTIYSLTGILAKLFEDAGYPIRFSLFVNGKTGSLKTALAKVIFCYFNPTKPRRLQTFRDTANSIDIYAGEQTDDIFLLDDFRPPTDKAHKAHMDEVLERIITHMGDGVSKNRTNANLEMVDGKIHRGGSVITGEYKSGGESSRLRCLFLDVQNDEIQGEKLRFFQNNPRIWTSVLARFVDYVENDYDVIVNLVNTNMQKRQDELNAQMFAKRCCEQGATLLTMHDILCGFLSSLGMSIMQEEKLEHVHHIMETLKKSESAAREMSTTNCYAKALYYIYLKKQIVLANSFQVYSENISKTDGFIEKGYLFLDDAKVKSLIHTHLSNNGQGYLDGVQGAAELADLGILSTFANGKKKRSFYARRTYDGKTHRLWKINLSRLTEVANE